MVAAPSQSRVEVRRGRGRPRGPGAHAGGVTGRGEGTREAVRSFFVNMDLLQLEFFPSRICFNSFFANLDFAAPFQ